MKMQTKRNHMALVKQALWNHRAKDAKARKLLAAIFSEETNGEYRFNGSDIEYLCAVLIEELTAKGLSPDFEPTAHGLDIENAIDWIRRTKQPRRTD